MTYKYDAVDLVKLYTEANHDLWNRWLTYCQQSQNIEELKKIRYGLQRGMDQAVKDKTSTPEIVHFFIRLNRSIENTLKKILKEKHPNPKDDPLIANKYNIGHMAAKKLRDEEFERFLKESAF